MRPKSVSRMLKSPVRVKTNQKSGRVIQRVCTLSSCPTSTGNGRLQLLTSLGLPCNHWAGMFCLTAHSLYHRNVCKQQFRHVCSAAIGEDRSTFSTKKATPQLSVPASRVSKEGFSREQRWGVANLQAPQHEAMSDHICSEESKWMTAVHLQWEYASFNQFISWKEQGELRCLEDRPWRKEQEKNILFVFSKNKNLESLHPFFLC